MLSTQSTTSAQLAFLLALLMSMDLVACGGPTDVHVPLPHGTSPAPTTNPNGEANNGNATTQPPPKPPPTDANTSCKPIAFASLNFEDNPGGNDPKAVALTFDDGPTGALSGTDNTAYILDQLKALNLHATFFLCGSVWTNVLSDPSAQRDIQRIVAEGHDFGNHTYDHKTLDQLSAAQVRQELAQEQAVLQDPNVLGPDAVVSLYRAPFGSPFQINNPNVSWVAPVTAQYGVNVGWGIDSDDWKCAQNNQDANCIINNVTYQLDQGHSGVILMHAVYKLTGDALPALVQAVRAHGYHIVTVQDMIQAKYDATSQEILQANAQAAFTSAQLAQAAANACGGNDFKIDPPY